MKTFFQSGALGFCSQSGCDTWNIYEARPLMSETYLIRNSCGKYFTSQFLMDKEESTECEISVRCHNRCDRLKTFINFTESCFSRQTAISAAVCFSLCLSSYKMKCKAAANRKHISSRLERRADGSDGLSSHTDSSFCSGFVWFLSFLAHKRSASSRRRISSSPTSFFFFPEMREKKKNTQATATSCTVSRLRFHGNSVRPGTHGRAARTKREKKRGRGKWGGGSARLSLILKQS